MENNKPDFEDLSNLYLGKQFIDYGDQNEQAEQQIKTSYKDGCEHVWNTYVVPLQEDNQRLKNDLLDALDLKEGKGPTALSMAIYEIKHLREEIERLKEDNEALSKGLIQNVKKTHAPLKIDV